MLANDTMTVLNLREGSDKYRKVCAHLYKRMNHSYAMNPHIVQDVDTAPMTWCYVSNKCQYLNGGEQVPGTLTSVRFNQKGDGNTALRELRGQTLLEIAKEQVLDLGMLLPAGC